MGIFEQTDEQVGGTDRWVDRQADGQHHHIIKRSSVVPQTFRAITSQAYLMKLSMDTTWEDLQYVCMQVAPLRSFCKPKTRSATFLYLGKKYNVR